jgi:hypothetical protein
MTSTPVKPDQFEITEKGITHKPTGCTFTPYPGNPTLGNVLDGQLGSKLQSGEDYRPEDVKTMMRQLWAKHLNRDD